MSTSLKLNWNNTTTAKAAIDAIDTRLTNLSNIALKNNLAGQSIPNLEIQNQATTDNQAVNLATLKTYLPKRRVIVRRDLTIPDGTQKDAVNVPNIKQKLISITVMRKRNDNNWFTQNYSNPPKYQILVSGTGNNISVFSEGNSSGNGTYEYSNQYHTIVEYEE